MTQTRTLPSLPPVLYSLTDPLPFVIMPELLLPVGVVFVLVGGGIAYGITKQRVDSAHERIDALDKRVTTTLAKLEVQLDTVIRMTERIDERTRREHGP